MSEPEDNPYAASTLAADVASEPSPNSSTFWPFLTWLVFTTLASVLATPADPISMYSGAIINLGGFVLGTILASRAFLFVRLICSAFWIILILCILFPMKFLDLQIAMAICGVTSAGLGFWARYSNGSLRRRVFFSFHIAYAMGLLLGLLVAAVASGFAFWFVRRRSQRTE